MTNSEFERLITQLEFALDRHRGIRLDSEQLKEVCDLLDYAKLHIFIPITRPVVTDEGKES